MQRNLTIFLFLIALNLTSCDPGKVLVIKAAEKENVSVIIYANGKILPYSRADKNDKVIIQVPSYDTVDKYKTLLLYGIGNWPNESITNLANNIDSIILNNSTGKIVLTDRSAIEKYLKKNRSGYAKSILTIEAK